jgi:hypothetical protein
VPSDHVLTPPRAPRRRREIAVTPTGVTLRPTGFKPRATQPEPRPRVPSPTLRIRGVGESRCTPRRSMIRAGRDRLLRSSGALLHWAPGRARPTCWFRHKQLRESPSCARRHIGRVPRPGSRRSSPRTGARSSRQVEGQEKTSAIRRDEPYVPARANIESRAPHTGLGPRHGDPARRQSSAPFRAGQPLRRLARSRSFARSAQTETGAPVNTSLRH